MKLFTRSILPSDSTPNDNTPEEAAPGTVGPPSAVPGDPHGVTIEGADGNWSPPRVLPSAWSGWPADWWTSWSSPAAAGLADTAWVCIDLNASLLSTMPPYLVNAAPSLSADWIQNPDPDVYSCWEEFAKQLFWEYQLGEAFVLATARYSTGWPARFHVVPGWMVNVELEQGVRRYLIGSVDVTGDMLHVRYTSTVDQAHGTGPLDAIRDRLVAAQVLTRYAFKLGAEGGIPSGVLQHPEKLSAEQASELKAQWVASRLSSIGEPAVLSGGVTWTATQINPRDMALLELEQFEATRIAVALGVPPIIVGLPSGGDSMTYANVTMLFDYHWRAGLRPKAQSVMSAVSQWALPRGTRVEVNRDAYIEPEPLVRAQTDQILNGIVDSQGNPVKTVEQIQEAERLTNSTPSDLSSGVLR